MILALVISLLFLATTLFPILLSAIIIDREKTRKLGLTMIQFGFISVIIWGIVLILCLIIVNVVYYV